MTEAKLPYVMKNTSTNAEKEDDSPATPDLCLYPIDDYAEQAYTEPKIEEDSPLYRSTREDAAISKDTAHTAWAWIVLFFEVKMEPCLYGFAHRGSEGLRGNR